MYGKLFVQDLIQSIPQSGIAKVLSAYLNSELSRFPSDSPVSDDQENKEAPAKVPTEDVLDDMIVHIRVFLL